MRIGGTFVDFKRLCGGVSCALATPCAGCESPCHLYSELSICRFASLLITPREFRFMTLAKLASLLVFLSGAVVVVAPVGAQGKGGGVARRLPPKFQSLSSSDARELGLVSELAVLWIGDVREGRGVDPVADLFGPFGGQRPVSEDATPQIGGSPNEADENERGLIVLSGLGRSQFMGILQIVQQQRQPQAAYAYSRAKMIAKLRQIRDREKETPAEMRTFEKEVIELGKEMGENEARLAVHQAWAFVDFESKFSPEQRNYLKGLRDNPDAFKLDSPAVKQTRILLTQLEEPLPLQMQDMAAKIYSYLSGTGEQNAARRPHRASTLLGRTSARFPDEVSRFLDTLNAAQHDLLIKLLAAERPYTADYVKKRTEFILALDGLKKTTTLNDSKFLKAGAAMGEIEARVALAQARVFEQLRLSLSQSQLFFIMQNLVPPQDSTQ